MAELIVASIAGLISTNTGSTISSGRKPNEAFETVTSALVGAVRSIENICVAVVELPALSTVTAVI